MHGQTLTYMYEIEPLATLNTTVKALIGLSDIGRAFFKELNMQLQIVVLPRKPSADDVRLFYESEQEKRGFPELQEEATQLSEAMVKKAVSHSFNYDIFLCVVENRPKFKSINLMTNFIDKYSGVYTERQSKKDFTNASITEASVFEIVKKHLTAEKVTEERVERVLKQLEFYAPEVSMVNLYDQPFSNHIAYTYETYDAGSSKLQQGAQYEQFFGIETFPEITKANNFLSVLQHANLPLTAVYKIDFKDPDVVHKEMLAKQRKITEDAKKFKREYERSSGEYQKALNAAHEGAKEFELTDEAAVRLQVFYRLHAETEAALTQYREKFIRYTKSAKLNINYYTGRQEILRRNIQPYRNEVKKHHLLNLKFLADLNVFGGSKIGDKRGHPFFKNVRTGGAVFLDYITLMSGQTANTEAVTLIYGSSGSGKSFLNFIMMISMLVMSGMPVLKINPKNDEQHIARKLKWLVPFYQNITLGSDASHRGALDPFLIHKDNVELATSEAKNDILLLMNALQYKEVNLYAIDRAVEQMIGQETNLNMVNLARELMKEPTTAYIGENILSMAKMQLGELLLGDDNANFNFEYKKLFTVLTFDNLPIVDDYDGHNLTHVFTNMLLSKTTSIVQNYINYWQRPANIVIDEYFVWSRYPLGKQAVSIFSRMIRSKIKHMYVLTQNVSDVDEESGLLNNTAVTLIGKLSSIEEINLAVKRYNLAGSIEKFLHKKLNANETTEVKDDYDFVLIDYNNRKAPIRVNVPNLELFAAYNNHFSEGELGDEA